MTAEQRRLLTSLSELARQALGDAFEEVSLVWSKRLDRENPNVVKIAERAESLAMTLRARFA